jgi:hypothetical protein
MPSQPTTKDLDLMGKRKDARLRMRKIRMERRLARQCICCGEPALVDATTGKAKTLCRTHADRKARYAAKYQAKTRRKDRKNGTCLCCHKRRAINGQTKCQTCKDRDAKSRFPREVWFNLGMCACGNLLEKGKKTCAHCRQRVKAIYHADKAMNRCVKCHKPIIKPLSWSFIRLLTLKPKSSPTDKPQAVCDRCKEKHRQKRVERQHARLCTGCGLEPPLPGRKLGANCTSPKGIIYATKVASGLCRDCQRIPFTCKKDKLCSSCRKTRKQERRYKNGYCITCGKRSYSDGYRECESCLIVRKRASAAASGLCKDCRSRPFTNIKAGLCSACAKQRRIDRRDKRLADGLCVKCGETPHADGKEKCVGCSTP